MLLIASDSGGNRLRSICKCRKQYGWRIFVIIFKSSDGFYLHNITHCRLRSRYRRQINYHRWRRQMALTRYKLGHTDWKTTTEEHLSKVDNWKANRLKDNTLFVVLRNTDPYWEYTITIVIILCLYTFLPDNRVA